MIVRCLQAHRLLHPPRQTSLLPRCHPRRRKSADSYTAQHRIRQTVPPLFRLPASDASEIGQMSGAIIDSMKTKIQEALNAEKVEIVDVEGDARHVTINVVASAFEGKQTPQHPSISHSLMIRQIERRSSANGLQSDLAGTAGCRPCRRYDDNIDTQRSNDLERRIQPTVIKVPFPEFPTRALNGS